MSLFLVCLGSLYLHTFNSTVVFHESRHNLRVQLRARLVINDEIMTNQLPCRPPPTSSLSNIAEPGPGSDENATESQVRSPSMLQRLSIWLRASRKEALSIFTEFNQKMCTYTAILFRGEPTRATCEAPDDSPENVLLFLSMLSSTKPSLLAPMGMEWESYWRRRKTRRAD